MKHGQAMQPAWGHPVSPWHGQDQMAGLPPLTPVYYVIKGPTRHPSPLSTFPMPQNALPSPVASGVLCGMERYAGSVLSWWQSFPEVRKGGLFWAWLIKSTKGEGTSHLRTQRLTSPVWVQSGHGPQQHRRLPRLCSGCFVQTPPFPHFSSSTAIVYRIASPSSQWAPPRQGVASFVWLILHTGLSIS